MIAPHVQPPSHKESQFQIWIWRPVCARI